MNFISELFVGGSVVDLGTIVYSLKRNIPVQNLYCICLFLDGKSHMEIIPSKGLCHTRYKNKKFKVAGVAYGMAEAMDLFLYIINMAAKNGRSFKRPEEWTR